MKKEYIIPTVFFLKYEEESELLANSLHDADGKYAAPDLKDDPLSGKTDLTISNDGTISEGDYAKKTDWFFDNGLFD